MNSKDAFKGSIHVSSGNWESKKSISSLKIRLHLSKAAYDAAVKSYSHLSLDALKNSSVCVIELPTGNPSKLSDHIRDTYKEKGELSKKPKLELIKTSSSLVIAFQPISSKKLQKRFSVDEKIAPDSSHEGLFASINISSAYGFEGIRQSFTNSVKRLVKENKLKDSDSELNSLFLGKTAMEIDYQMGRHGLEAAEKCLSALSLDQKDKKRALKMMKMVEVFKVLEVDLEFDSFRSLGPAMRKYFLDDPQLGRFISWMLNEPLEVRNHLGEICKLVAPQTSIKMSFFCKKFIVIEANLMIDGLYNLTNQFQHMVSNPREFAERLDKTVKTQKSVQNEKFLEVDIHDSSIEVDNNLKNLMYQH